MGWDDNGLPTERRVQNYYGVRCDPSLPYDADFTPPEKPDPKRQVPISRPNFVELCEQLVERGREGLRGAVAHARPVGRLEAALHDHRPEGPDRSASARSCATSPAARPTCRRRRPCGTSPSRPRSPRPSSRRGSTPAHYHRVAFHRPDGTPVYDRDHPPRADPRGGRADRAPRRRALPAAVRHHRHLARSSASRSRCSPTRRPSRTRAPASRCAARSATSPTSPGGASSQLPVRTVIGRDGRLLRETPEWLAARAGRGGVRRARRQDRRSPPARRWSRCCASPATSTASRSRRSGWRTSTRRATSRSRSSPPGSGTSATAAATPTLRDEMLARGAEIDVDPGPHEAPLRQLGRAASTATG